MGLKYKSEIFKVLHQSSVADFEAGAITEEEMREFDRDCLVQEPQPVNEQLVISNGGQRVALPISN